MLRSALTVCPTIYVPLSRLAFCVDCEACFQLGPDTCPACSSETWVPLSTFVGEQYAPIVPTAA
jgi:hypothetical protein